MKTIKYFLLGLLIVGNLSCSSDDDKVETFGIVGSWSITEGYIERGSIIMDVGGMDVPVEFSGSLVDIDNDNRLNFKEDKTFTSFTGNIALEMNITVMGTTQAETFEGSDLFGQGTWEINGRELKIHNENGTTIKYQIDNLNGSHLELSSNVKDMALESGPNPMLESMDIIVKIKLQKA